MTLRYKSNIKARKSGPLTVHIHRKMKQLWTEAVRAFIRSAIKEIRVDTGMAAGSILPLSRAVRSVQEIRAEIPAGQSKIGYTSLSGRWVKKGKKSLSTGERLGGKAYTLEFGTPQRPKFVFEFKIVIFHYILHELGIVPGDGPWNSLEAGQKAFEAFIENNFERYLPDIGEYIVTGKLN